MEAKNIVIVGGGISGLSAAYFLQKAIQQNQLAYKVKLVEATNHLGGKIKTKKLDGYTIELGPDSLLSRKPAIVNLVKELGLEDKMIRNATGQSYILHNKKLHKLPKGTFMGVPKEVGPLLSSGLISTKGKIRALADIILPKGKEQDDVSIGSLMRRRFGNELVDRQISPLLSGIHSGDIDEMSIKAINPLFYQVEQEYGSVIKGLQKAMLKSSKAKVKKQAGMFFSFEDGLETIINRLVEKLESDTVIKNCAVDHIERKSDYYHLLLSDGKVLKADAVVMATEHQAIPKIFSQYDFLKNLYDIPSTSSANVVLTFDSSAIKKDVEGTGFQVSRASDDFRITACTWTNKKWPSTTPEGKVMLRCYVGKPDDQEIVDLSDETITKIVMKDLKKVMKIKGEPEFVVVTRWKNARPQYTVGHLGRVKEIRNQISETLPGVYLVGSSYDGAGIPDCIGNAEKLADEVLGFLN